MMDYTTIPIVRVELDSMRYQVIHAFSDHTEEMKRAVEEAVNRAVEDYNIEDEAYRCALNILDRIVKDAVKHALADVVAASIKERFIQAFPESKIGSPEWKKAHGYGPE